MNEFVRQFREQYPGAYDDMSDVDVLRAVHAKFYADMEYGAFLNRLEEVHGQSNTGTTPQPPFAGVDRGIDVPLLGRMSVGGALDALVAFGNGVAFRVPEMLSGDTRAAMQELRRRDAGATLLAEGAGGLTTAMIPMAVGTRAAQAANPYGFRIVQNTPSLARRAGGAVVDFAKKRALQGLATTGTGALGAYIYDRITRDR